MKIALVAPPMVAVPPRRYAGTERVVAALGDGFTARGHEVTLFAPGDSEVSYDLVPTVPKALWGIGDHGDATAWFERTIELVARESDRFDVIHSHLDVGGFPLVRRTTTPVVSTLHGRLDAGDTPAWLAAYPDAALIAISASQRRWFPDHRWLATIHHGMILPSVPAGRAGEELVLVGRATREKGIAEAIELAERTGRPLRVATKAHDAREQRYVDEVIRPAEARGTLEFLGEVSTNERDELMARAFATLMLGAWPEPFGLVAIESLALGTPVIARRAGALPEIIEHGVDGFLVDDVEEAEFALGLVGTLDRDRIRRRARARFSVDRMVDEYERVFRDLIGRAPTAAEARDTLVRTPTEAADEVPAGVDRDRPARRG
jgi:glycosyltransferase involved in cell wall biosynthesis